MVDLRSISGKWARADSCSYTVVTTVRSTLKGDQILAAHPSVSKEQLSYVVVPDIAQEGAFDQVIYCLQAVRERRNELYELTLAPRQFNLILPLNMSFTRPHHSTTNLTTRSKVCWNQL